MLNWKSNTLGDSYLYELHRERLATQHAQDVIQAHFRERLLESDTLYLIVGTDSGLLANHVRLHRARVVRSKYIFIEAPNVLEALAGRLPENDADVVIGCLSDWNELTERVGYQRYAFMNRIRVVRSMAAEDDFAEIYRPLEDELEALNLKTLFSLGTQLGHKNFLELTILNAPDHLRVVTEIAGRIAGRDVLVLGGGPSLDEHIEWIRAHRSRFVVLAITRIAGYLAEHGVQPDFYLVIDPFRGMFNVSRDAIRQSDRVPLIAGHHSFEMVVANWKSEVYCSGDRLPWASSLNVPSFGAQGPTVTHFALSCAIEAGARRIFLSGFDQCYSRKGLRSHYSGSLEAKSGPRLDEHTVAVRTYSGEPAETFRHFLLSIDTSARLAEHAASKGIPVFNLAAGAAVVPGIDWVAPELVTFADDASAPHSTCEDPQADSRFAENQRYLEELRSELMQVRRWLDALEDDLAARQPHIDRLFDARGVIRPKESRKVKGIDAALAAHGQAFATFIERWGVAHFVSTITTKSADEITPADLTAYYRTYYAGCLATIEEIRTVIDKALAKCERRLAEYRRGPLEDLETLWREHEEFLRVHTETVRHHMSDARGYAAACERLDADFARLCAATEAIEVDRISNYIDQPSLVSKSYQLLKKGRAEPLDELVEYVVGEASDRYSSGAIALIEGFRWEAHGRTDEALAAYERVINANEPELIETALKQILIISNERNDHAQALQAVECLAMLSPLYLRYKAELLHFLGETAAALDAFADCHEAFPADVDLLARIAEVYFDTRNREQALTLIADLKQLYPQHPAVARVAAKIDAAPVP